MTGTDGSAQQCGNICYVWLQTLSLSMAGFTQRCQEYTWIWLNWLQTPNAYHLWLQFLQYWHMLDEVAWPGIGWFALGLIDSVVDWQRAPAMIAAALLGPPVSKMLRAAVTNSLIACRYSPQLSHRFGVGAVVGLVVGASTVGISMRKDVASTTRVKHALVDEADRLQHQLLMPEQEELKDIMEQLRDRLASESQRTKVKETMKETIHKCRGICLKWLQTPSAYQLWSQFLQNCHMPDEVMWPGMGWFALGLMDSGVDHKSASPMIAAAFLGPPVSEMLRAAVTDSLTAPTIRAQLSHRFGVGAIVGLVVGASTVRISMQKDAASTQGKHVLVDQVDSRQHQLEMAEWEELKDTGMVEEHRARLASEGQRTKLKETLKETIHISRASQNDDGRHHAQAEETIRFHEETSASVPEVKISPAAADDGSLKGLDARSEKNESNGVRGEIRRLNLCSDALSPRMDSRVSPQPEVSPRPKAWIEVSPGRWEQRTPETPRSELTNSTPRSANEEDGCRYSTKTPPSGNSTSSGGSSS